MLLKEFYDTIGGGYESVRQRIPKDELIKKFVIKFLTDPSYSDLSQALEKEDYEGAFRAVHTLKGVSANLGFLKLNASSGNLTELLRHRDQETPDKEQCRELFWHVSEDYRAVVSAIGLLDV